MLWEELICLSQIWKGSTNGKAKNLTFGKIGNLGVASYCAFIFDPNGELLSKVCGDAWMEDISYSNGKFGFASHDDHVYIISEDGKTVDKIHVGSHFNSAITMTPNGFVACSHNCGFFDFNGNKLWEVDVGYVTNGPAYYRGYWYVADMSWNKLWIIRDGEIIKNIDFPNAVWDTAVCDKYLGVSTQDSIRLYDLSKPENPEELWEKDEFALPQHFSFSPDCKYIAVAVEKGKSLAILTIEGETVLRKKYGNREFADEVLSVDWFRNRIAVGLGDGRIYVYKVHDLGTPFSLKTEML